MWRCSIFEAHGNCTIAVITQIWKQNFFLFLFLNNKRGNKIEIAMQKKYRITMWMGWKTVTNRDGKWLSYFFGFFGPFLWFFVLFLCIFALTTFSVALFKRHPTIDSRSTVMTTSFHFVFDLFPSSVSFIFEPNEWIEKKGQNEIHGGEGYDTKDEKACEIKHAHR